MSAKTLNMRDLPLLVTAWFEPADAKNTEAPARSFNLVVSPKNAKENKIVRIKLRPVFDRSATAAFTADIQSSPAVFDSIKIDASSSFSPVGGARLPLKYKFYNKTDVRFRNNRQRRRQRSRSGERNAARRNVDGSADSQRIPAERSAMGDYARRKDAKGIGVGALFIKIKAVPKGRFYAELIKDRNETRRSSFYLVRYRRYGSFAVPAFDYDLVPGGAGSCKNDAPTARRTSLGLSQRRLAQVHLPPGSEPLRHVRRKQP
jgi:hypothetical protein